MDFLDPVARWLPSVELKLNACSWATFESMVLDRFGKDQHAILVRQLFHIKQTSSVAEYIEKFAGLVDELTAYESKPDPLHYTMCFIDGLRDDIRVVVLIQRPIGLDTAYVPAKLQEEVSLLPKKRVFRKADYTISTSKMRQLCLILRGILRPTRLLCLLMTAEVLLLQDPNLWKTNGLLSRHIDVLKVSASVALRNGPKTIVVLIRFSFTHSRSFWKCSKAVMTPSVKIASLMQPQAIYIQPCRLQLCLVLWLLEQCLCQG
jgi:hypothetical protein